MLNMDSDSDSDSISDNRRMAQRERNLRWEPQNCSADLKRVFKTVGEFWDSMFARDEFSLKYTALEAAQLKELFVLIAANNPNFRNTKRERRMVYQALYQCRKGVPDSSIRDMWVVQSRFHHRKAYTWILRALPDLREDITEERAVELEAVAAKKLGTVGLLGCGDFKIVPGAGTFDIEKSDKQKGQLMRVAVKVFVVSSADGQIISANIFRTGEHDTTLLKKTNICKKYRKQSLPWFSRRVAGKKYKVPGHFAFDDQADRCDYIAKKCPHLLSSYGKLSGQARETDSYHKGLGIALEKWQKRTSENTFMEIGRKYRLIRQLPLKMQRFAHIKKALLVCLKLYNFGNKNLHEKVVAESVSNAARVDPKPRGNSSIRRILRMQEMYHSSKGSGSTEYEPIVKKRYR